MDEVAAALHLAHESPTDKTPHQLLADVEHMVRHWACPDSEHPATPDFYNIYLGPPSHHHSLFALGLDVLSNVARTIVAIPPRPTYTIDNNPIFAIISYFYTHREKLPFYHTNAILNAILLHHLEWKDFYIHAILTINPPFNHILDTIHILHVEHAIPFTSDPITRALFNRVVRISGQQHPEYYSDDDINQAYTDDPSSITRWLPVNNNDVYAQHLTDTVSVVVSQSSDTNADLAIEHIYLIVLRLRFLFPSNTPPLDISFQSQNSYINRLISYFSNTPGPLSHFFSFLLITHRFDPATAANIIVRNPPILHSLFHAQQAVIVPIVAHLQHIDFTPRSIFSTTYAFAFAKIAAANPELAPFIASSLAVAVTTTNSSLRDYLAPLQYIVSAIPLRCLQNARDILHACTFYRADGIEIKHVFD